MPDTNRDSLEINVPNHSVPTGTPVRGSWRDANVSDHFVQFYQNDEVLVEAVAGFMATALKTVEGGIIVATLAHRQAIAQRLQAQGIDVTAAMARNQFVLLDAEATLATFMVDGMPDEKLFHRTVGYVVTRTLSAGFRVRAFGEMVAILCAQGNATAAIQLEQLWNNLAQTCRFSLFCAYPALQFPNGENDPVFRQVCAAHTAVIPVA